MIRVLQQLKNAVILPALLCRGFVKKDFRKSEAILLSLSPVINTINDHTGFIIKDFSFRRYGFWGYCPRFSMGINFGAGYGFLSNFLNWKLGVCGYTLLSMLAYWILFISFSDISLQALIFINVIAALVYFSPYFKNSVFICGRHDILGWPFLMIGLLFMLNQYYLPSFFILTFAFMIHPSVSVVCIVYMAFFLVSGTLTFQNVALILAAQILNIFWYIPFIQILIKPHNTPGWKPTDRDSTRSDKIFLLKLCGMVCLLVPALVISREKFVYIFLLVPFSLFLISYYYEVFLNRFSIELLWTVSAAVAVYYSNNNLLWIPYIISLYFYASPAPRFAFPFKPFTIDLENLNRTFQPIDQFIPDQSRISLLSFAETADEWRLIAKYSFIMNAWIVLQNKVIEQISLSPFGGIIFIHPKENIGSQLKQLSQKYGISHFVVPDLYNDKINGLDELDYLSSCLIPKTGSVPGMDFHLYQIDRPVSRLLPQGVIEEGHDGSISISCTPGLNELKYQPIKGICLMQDGKEIKITPGNEFNFFYNNPRNMKIELTYKPLRLWLPSIFLSRQQ